MTPRPLTIVVATGLVLAHAIAGLAARQSARSVALVLDASGSMTAKLPDAATRIDAAKAAVADLVGKLPAETRVALRAYGHQSPTKEKNCQDTALVVPFDTASANRAAVTAALPGIRAQGYTPITHSLKLAAEDLVKEESASHAIVLVSDGKETCTGDPCATARALAAADTRLVIHAIGLGVDGAARYQLRCIASVARGTYVDAGSAAELHRALSDAAQRGARKTVDVKVAGPGNLRIEGATAYAHQVLDAATGKKVTEISAVWPEREVPAGIYNVTFDNGVWKGVEVKSGEKTVLRPGQLVIEGADLRGNDLIDPETGEVTGRFLSHKGRVPLLPTRFTVTFGRIAWPETVEIKEGEATTLRPGGLKVVSSSPFKFRVLDADGQPVGEVSSAISRIALPPGKYLLEMGSQKTPVELKAGEDVEITIGQPLAP